MENKFLKKKKKPKHKSKYSPLRSWHRKKIRKRGKKRKILFFSVSHDPRNQLFPDKIDLETRILNNIGRWPNNLPVSRYFYAVYVTRKGLNPGVDCLHNESTFPSGTGSNVRPAGVPGVVFGGENVGVPGWRRGRLSRNPLFARGGSIRLVRNVVLPRLVLRKSESLVGNSKEQCT